MIANNDPNVRFAKRTVRITLRHWDHELVVEKVIGGNCNGLAVIREAVEQVITDLCGDDEEWSFVMKNPAGGELVVESSGTDPDEIEDWVVGAEIVAVVPEARRGASAPSTAAEG